MKKHPNDAEIKKEFNHIKNKTNIMIRKIKRQYISKQIINASTDIRKIWKVINGLLKKHKVNKTIITKLKSDTTTITNTTEICNYLNKYYVNIANELQKNIKKAKIHFPEIHNDKSLLLKDCTKNELYKIICSLKKSPSAGEDNITARDIQFVYPIIEDMLTDLINKCLKNGGFPKSCKTSKIVPIFKKGCREDAGNYRPIAVVSVFSKIIEKILKRRLMSFLGISRQQYGFQEHSSTLGATIDLFESILRKLENGEYVVAVLIDLQKAFDTVDHRLLLQKLYNFGIQGPAFKLIESFLDNRLQYTCVDSCASSKETVKTGVPQGSVLGPLLYLLYVESLSIAGLKAEHFMFADDTMLLYSDNDQKKLERLINNDLDRFYNWLCANKLSINEEKTNYLRFQQKNKKTAPLNLKINNKPIYEVFTCKYLGLNIDAKLSWDKHIDAISKKLRGLIGATRNFNSYLDSKSKNMLYFTHIQSVLSYLIAIWSNTSQANLNRVQRLQNKAVKFIYNLDFHTPSKDLYCGVNILPIKKLKQLECCKLIYKIKNDLLKCNVDLKLNSSKHCYNTRIASDIALHKARTNKGLIAPIQVGSKMYNELPKDIKNTQQYDLFVTKLKNHFKL